jgi:hypothetical protein
MLLNKPAFEKRIKSVKNNFRPIKHADEFTEDDGAYYAFQLVFLQILCRDWPRCAKKIKQELGIGNPPHLPKQFRGHWLFALAQFYRYYLHRRRPAGNDYGDFIQVVPIAYCRLAVVEKNLQQELQHIQKNEPMLNQTEIYGLDFVRNLTGVELR